MHSYMFIIVVLLEARGRKQCSVQSLEIISYTQDLMLLLSAAQQQQQ